MSDPITQRLKIVQNTPPINGSFNILSKASIYLNDMAILATRLEIVAGVEEFTMVQITMPVLIEWVQEYD